MERQYLFEAALVLTLIGLSGLLMFMIVSTPPGSESWEMQSNGTIDYMFVGSDDTLYTFSGNDIMAVAKDGSRLWDLTIPAEWKVLNDWEIPVYSSAITHDYGTQVTTSSSIIEDYPVAGECDGRLYLYVIGRLKPDDMGKAWNITGEQFFSRPAAIIAISQHGTIEWEYPVPTNISISFLRSLERPSDESLENVPAIMAQKDRVYIFHDYKEEVLDDGGELVFALNNVSSPAAVDENGLLYVVRGVEPSHAWPTEDNVYTGEMRWGTSKYNRVVPSDIIDAYSPDGRLIWSTDIGINATGLYVERDLWPSCNGIPIYANRTLYVPVQRGFAAIDLTGGLKWVRQVENGPYNPDDWLDSEGVTYAPLSIMPVDSKGNAYLARLDWSGQADAIYVISPDGNVSLPGANTGANTQLPDTGTESLAGWDGIIYGFDNNFPISPTVVNESLASGQIDHGFIVAYDVKRGARLWNFTVPSGDCNVLTLNASNYRDVLLRSQYIVPITEDYRYFDTYGQPFEMYPYSINAQKDVKIYPGLDVIYVRYYYDIYEYPLVLNRSRCVYAGGLYALDRDGNLIWERQPDGLVTKSAAGNGVFYYLTNHGKMGGGTVGIATGAALLSAVYLFFRFFMVGAVARARSRIDKNENRNRVLGFVAANPGATAVDLVNGMGMNLGTIRYHLFVLSHNHRIVVYKEGGKYMRYFTNSGTYTPEERVALSVLRRESLRRMVATLAESPGLTSLELSQQLGVSTTAAHRHINELMGRDIIVKVYGTEKGNVFFINDKYRGIVTKTLGRTEI